MTDIRAIKLVVTKNHFPHVLSTHKPPSGDPRYSIRIPSEAVPHATHHRNRDDGLGLTTNASSKHAPVVIPGGGQDFYHDQWEGLLRQARRWSYPVDYLLVGREVEVAFSTYQMSHSQFRGRPFNVETFVGLHGVRIGGNLEEDEGLAAHIIEVQGWFK